METLFVFLRCTIVNLAMHRQFTNVAWDWIIKNKKTNKQNKQTNKTNKKKQNKKKSKLH